MFDIMVQNKNRSWFENEIEYWYARELQLVLDYKEWRKFENVIKKAIDACENSGISAF